MRRAYLINTGVDILVTTALSSIASYDTNAQQKAPSSPTDPQFKKVEETVLLQMQSSSGG